MKLQPQKEITVDGDKYIVQLYGPTYGFTLYAKLIRLFSEPLIKLFQVFKGKGVNIESILTGNDITDLNLDAVSEAISKLFSQLSDDQVVPLMQEVLACTFTAARSPVNAEFETLFMGRYAHAMKLVAKTVGVQYPDFLSGIVKRSSAAKSDSALAQQMKAM